MAFSKIKTAILWTAVLFTLASIAGIIFYIIAINELDFSILENRSKAVYDDSGRLIGYSLSQDNDSLRLLTKADEVSPLYLKMLIANEDRRFYSHPGVDFKALGRALITNIQNNEITSGGSTLAMQVSKKLTGHPRTYINKLKEVIEAIYITEKYGREQVLDWYLTLAPFGSNIEGVKAASLRWFGHSPKLLTPSEAALLTAFPRVPELIRPDRNHRAAIFYRNEALRMAFEKGIISEDTKKMAMLDEIPAKIFKIKQDGITLANWLFSNYPKHEFYTYIDPKVQKILLNEGEIFKNTHHDGAVLSIVAIDDEKHRITGILGSSDLSLTELCLPFMKRSAGSALKPFAYGMAFNEKKLHPETLLHDNSKLYGLWNPQNFTKKYMGQVTAAKALTNSLNLPALEVIEMVGPARFIAELNRGHKRIFARNDGADYSVILGSPAIKLTDLTELYGMINNDGLLYDYQLLKDTPIEKEIRLLNPDSARVLSMILKRTTRPLNGAPEKELFYKTGTSSRFIDALAIGSLGKYTVGVAIRFPNNVSGAYRYTGFKDAAPILFNVMHQIKPEPLVKPELTSELFSITPPQALKENRNEENLIDKKALKIIFPSNGATVVPDNEGRVYIKYTGGEGHIYFTINNEQQSEENFITPEKEGIYSISVLDEYGRSDAISFRVLLDN